MAIVRLAANGYGQLERNQTVFGFTGRIEAQCALDTSVNQFGATAPLENGMLVGVDKVSNKIKKVSTDAYPIGIAYTVEHLYDERKRSIKDFACFPNDCRPRIGYLSIGEKFTTNTVCYDTSEFATETNLDTALAALATTPLYGGIDASGAIKVSATAPTAGPVLLVIAKTTMPDGQKAIKFQVVNEHAVLIPEAESND